MNLTVKALLQDLAPFADLGTGAPLVTEYQETLVCRLTREGIPYEFVIKANGSVLERSNTTDRHHISIKALLASPIFANLGKWADSQKILLQDRLRKESIELSGRSSINNEEGGVELLDSSLIYIGRDNKEQQPRVLVTLIDGPAGIGKTSLIRRLSHRRASDYRIHQNPLILHVESRGRVLQNITDLMAFSLQTLRLNVTYDQIPVLVRLGLITLAIDGFDELGDPNGYELAWAQVNDLIVAARGKGVIILSGRETFISRNRMESALSSIDNKLDSIETFTLNLISPAVARRWLLEKSWTIDQIEGDAAKPLFEDGSYALRPFFLSELSRKGVSEQIEKGDIEDLLSFLVDAMTSRESEKFGPDIEGVTSKEARIEFVSRLMEEIARDLAENQTGSISAESVAWLSEVVAYQLVPEGLVGVLKNRAGVIAFLAEDDRRGYKRFAHEQIQNYFLAKVTISSLISGETPKYVRRNIFGPEFLENFCDVFRHSGQRTVDLLSNAVQQQITVASIQDRSKRNLGALTFAICSVAKPSTTPVLKDLHLEEVYCSESLADVTLLNTSISQLYARSADLRKLKFLSNCFIVSMIADDGTVPSETLPMPSIINIANKTLSSPEEKAEWLFDRMYPYDRSNRFDLTERLSEFTAFGLLARVARYKPFWLKDGDERASRRILDDPDWNVLSDILQRHGFLVERTDVPASGRPGSFFHVKNRHALRSVDELPVGLLAELIEKSNIRQSKGRPLDY